MSDFDLFAEIENKDEPKETTSVPQAVVTTTENTTENDTNEKRSYTDTPNHRWLAGKVSAIEELIGAFSDKVALEFADAPDGDIRVDPIIVRRNDGSMECAIKVKYGPVKAPICFRVDGEGFNNLSSRDFQDFCRKSRGN